MNTIFLHLFNISVSASYMIIAVIILRLLLKKAPKYYTCILWGLVALRLFVPIKIESILSLLPSGETVSPQILSGSSTTEAVINTGFAPLDTMLNNSVEGFTAPAYEYTKSPLELFVNISSVIWLVVAIGLLILGILSFFRLKYRLRFSVLENDGCYRSDAIASPFIFGIIKPKVYLPFNIDDSDKAYIIAHERAHIKRLDYLTKIFSFILLAVYWFNPLVWIAYILFQKDTEIACDQSVIKKMATEEKKNYSFALLKYSMNPKMRAITPLAFGEISVKQRIKQVMSYKKPTLWVTIIAFVISIAVILCFMASPKAENVTSVSYESTNENTLETTTSETQTNTDSSMPSKADNYRLYIHKTDYDKIFEITDNDFRMQYNAEFALQGVGAVDVIVKGQRMDMITAITDKKITVENIITQAKNDLKAGVCKGQAVSPNGELITAYVYENYALIFDDREYLSGDPHTAYTDIRITHIDIFNKFLSHLIYVDEKESKGRKVSDAAFEKKNGYAIKYNNISTADIYVGGKRMDLWEAIKSGKITEEELLNHAKEDSANGFISIVYVQDGGTKRYDYPGYTIIKYNTMPSGPIHDLHPEDYNDSFYRDLVISKW